LNQSITLRQLSALLYRVDRLILVLGLVILVVAYVGYNQYRETTAAQEELATLTSRIRVIQDDLAYLQANDQTAALRGQLEGERSKSQPQALPTRPAAREFSEKVVNFAAENGLPFNTFDRVDASVPIGTKEFSSLHHSLEVQGSGEALSGLLQLVNEFPTAKVLELSFTRAGDRSQWQMTLEMDVFYR